MNDTMIDIVIPVYNPGKAFKSCIKSVLKQTFRDWRLILVDDGSTDGSEKLCDEYARKDDRITVIHQKNQGCVAARKNGVLACDPGHYVTFCDSDDMLTKDALEKLYSAATENNADMVCGNSIRFYKGIKQKSGFKPPCFESKMTYTHDEIIDKLYVSCFGITNLPVNLWGKLYRYDLFRETVDQPPVVRFFAEDLSIMVFMLPRVKRLTIIPDIIYKYRIGGGTNRFMPSMLDDCLAMYHYKRKLALEWPMPQDIDRLMKIELKNMAFTWLRMYREKGGFSDKQYAQEVERVCNLAEIIEAVKPDYKEKNLIGFRNMVRDLQYDQIIAFVDSAIHRTGLKKTIKKLLTKL